MLFTPVKNQEEYSKCHPLCWTSQATDFVLKYDTLIPTILVYSILAVLQSGREFES